MKPRLLLASSAFVFSVLTALAFAGTTLDGPLYMQHASGNGRANGDFVSNSATGLNAPYRFYVEVPSGLTNLTIDIFDSDFGIGVATDENAAGSGNRDTLNGASYNSSVRYRVLRPNGTQEVSITRNNTNGVNNGWETIASVANPANGHWTVEVDVSSAITTGDDINGYGVRAHDGTPGSGGTELNVYMESYFQTGIHDVAGSTSFIQYPYITSGCDCYLRDFDADDATAGTASTVSVVSRNGSFTANNLNLNSGNDTWQTQTFAGFADDGPPVAGRLSDGYGIWRMTILNDARGTSDSNYTAFYVPSFQSPSAPFTGGGSTFSPNSQPEEDSFRIYLPRDGSTFASPLAPQKPYVRQFIHDVVSGPNPPRNGQNTFVRMRVEVVNPTAHSITFSASNLVTVNVPPTRVQYQNPSALVTQGSIVSQPANGGSGNITWNPGIVASGATARLEYQIRIQPSGNNQTTTITGTPASNGTTARFVDATGNTTQTRATYTFGPICQLSIVSTSAVNTGGSTLSVDLLDFDADLTADGSVRVNWTTQDEVENAGFEVIEAQRSGAVGVEGDLLTLTPIPALGPEGGAYEWIDPRKLNQGEERGYYLVDIDLAGNRTYHGPVYVSNFKVTLETAVGGWEVFN